MCSFGYKYVLQERNRRVVVGFWLYGTMCGLRLG